MSKFYHGAWVICEPRFTGSREICELWKSVNLKSKFTGKSREPSSHKFIEVDESLVFEIKYKRGSELNESKLGALE